MKYFTIITKYTQIIAGCFHRKICHKLVITFILWIFSGSAGFASLPSYGQLQGKVTNKDTREVVDWVVVMVVELNRWESTRESGVYFFKKLPVGEYTLKTYRIGYFEKEKHITIKQDELVTVDLELEESPVSGEHITVTADIFKNRSEFEQPDVLVSGEKLRKNLGQTIAETIDYEPGISQRTMGPAPARPVMRGLSGDRLLILEDGQRTGDLSATSADHAVSIDPLNSERIEVIRGPASLQYGANTLGGVINVIKDNIPPDIPQHLHGAGSVNGESVNLGKAMSLNLLVPINSFAIKADGTIRGAENMQTPEGELKNTSIQTLTGTIGLSHVERWGRLGAAFGSYNSQYGIPPDPLGGHPAGVDINLEKQNTEAILEVEKDISFLKHTKIQHQFVRYFHEEKEKSGSVGMNFGVLTHNFSADFEFSNLGAFKNNKFGIWSEYRDFNSGGLSFTPATREFNLAGFLYNELEKGRLTFSASIRYDLKNVRPEEEKLSQTVGFIRDRNFGGLSASLAQKFALIDNLHLGFAWMRSFRAPGIEELFSEGPHLAAYSYEVGNAELEPEIGNGFELSSEYNVPKASFRVALFQNQITNYSIPINTGERSRRRADLFVYQYTGPDVLFRGVEGEYVWEFHRLFNVIGTMSFVKGELEETGKALPRIPPFEMRNALHYHKNNLNVSLISRFATQQNRIGEFEKKTAGYHIFDFALEYRFTNVQNLQIVSLKIENAVDTIYRKHLNRVKEILPEPGRNVKLLYKIYF